MASLINEKGEGSGFQEFLEREKNKKRMASRLIYLAACDGISVDDFLEICDIAKKNGWLSSFAKRTVGITPIFVLVPDLRRKTFYKTLITPYYNNLSSC